jgi:hypothetical protein
MAIGLVGGELVGAAARGYLIGGMKSSPLKVL